MKTILVDIGNTHVGFFLYDGFMNKEVIITHTKPEMIKAKKKIYSYLEGENCFLIVSSVNSFSLKELKGVFSDNKIFSIEVLKTTEFDKRAEEMGFKISNMDFLASDLLFDILGTSKASLVADYGTASKLLYVSSKKEFVGGMIGAGLRSINRSLSASTDLLDEFPLEVPSTYLSLQTKDSINASSIYGECFKIMGLYKKIKEDYKEKDLVLVITGGDAYYLDLGFKKLGFNDYTYDPYHIFKGMEKGLKINEDK